MFNWYGNLMWECPLGDCGTSPCDYCKSMMEEIDGFYQMPPTILKRPHKIKNSM